MRAGDQADVLMWRAIGIGHLLLANITQNLEVRSARSDAYTFGPHLASSMNGCEPY